MQTTGKAAKRSRKIARMGPMGAPSLEDDQVRRILEAMRGLYKQCNHNATELARRLKMSQTSVSELLAGRNRPSFKTAERVAQLAGIPVWSLLGGGPLPTATTHPVLMATIALLGDRIPAEARERVLAAAVHLPDVAQATWIALLLDPAHTSPESRRSKPPSSREAPDRTTEIPVVPKQPKKT